MPELQPVNSDAIQAMGYDPMEQVLYVQFRNKKDVYSYRGVSEDSYNTLLSAPSIGKHFMSQIRPNHTGVKA